MNTIIEVNGLRIYARHGVAPQERQIGNLFEIDVHLSASIHTSALEHDQLEGTINYADIVDVIRQQMATPSALLENVAWRIHRALTEQFPGIAGGMIRVAKLTPPLGAELSSVAIRVEW